MEKENEKQILRRYLNGTYNTKEVDQLTNCLRDDTHKEIVSQLAEEVWEESLIQPKNIFCNPSKSQEEAQELLRKMQKMEPNKKTWSRKLLYTTISIAASLLLILGVNYLLSYSIPQQTLYTCIETSFGEKRQVTLPDGSTITLNACSKLQYPPQFTGKLREVHLEGEAFFKVAPNAEMPFHITTQHFEVQVLGTAFNIKSYDNDKIQSVEVESGKVQIDLPEDRIRLSKQEQIVINRQAGEYSKKKNRDNKVARWRKGYLKFNHTPIEDVAHELERIYHCQISFQNGQEFDNLITGEHENQSLESILESLHYICNINYKINQNQVLLYKQP